MIRSTPGTSAFGMSFLHLAFANVSRTSPVAEPGLAAVGKRTHLPVMMLDPTDEETDALAELLSRAIDEDRYPLSPRIQTLKAILSKIRPEPVREPLPPRKGRLADVPRRTVRNGY
jgi:hypothetical protein